MDEQPTPVQIEYRQLKFRVFRAVVLLALLPFGVLGLLSYVSAPPQVLSVGMAVTMAGIFASAIYVWRVWACPVCKAKLWIDGGTLGGQCLRCKAQLYIPWRSKSGRIFP